MFLPSAALGVVMVLGVTDSVDTESRKCISSSFIHFHTIYKCLNSNYIMNTPSLCDTLLGLQFGQLGHCVGHVRQDKPLSFAAFGICFASTLGIVPAVDLDTTINKIEKIIKWNYCSNDTQI